MFDRLFRDAEVLEHRKQQRLEEEKREQQKERQFKARSPGKGSGVEVSARGFGCI